MSTRYIDNLFYNGGYYHIYNRGDRKLITYFSSEDKELFINLLKRYLTSKELKKSNRRTYPNFHGKIKLHAFQIMDNHYHMVLEQTCDDQNIIPKFLHCLIVSYSKIIRDKYDIQGTIFKGSYMSKLIASNSNSFDELEEIIRVINYIHSNDKSNIFNPFSSLNLWMQDKEDWLSKDFLNHFINFKEYLVNLENYIALKSE